MTSTRTTVLLACTVMPLIAAACSANDEESVGAPPSTPATVVTTDVASSAEPSPTTAAATPTPDTTSPTGDDGSCNTGEGGRILAVADADMEATAYTDFQLGTPQPGVTDSLTIIDPSAATPTIVGSTAAPNAVTGPVWVFDTSADGSTAYVIETTQANDGSLTTFPELFVRQGDRLSVIDLCAPDGPTVTSSSTTAIGPTTVSASPDGAWLAVAHRSDIRVNEGVDPNAIDPNNPDPALIEVAAPAGVVLHPIVDGDVGAPVPLELPTELLGTATEVTHAAWSPDGRALAVAVRDTRSIGFFTRDGDRLVPWGNVVAIDEGTFGGTWSPDGRFFYVNNIRGAARPELPADLDELLGSVQTVRVAASGTPATEAAHELIQTESTPIFPEGIAISPDGTLLATVNMQATALPPSNGLFSPTATVSLWTRDADSGLLTKVSDTPFDGILPEGADFDPSSTRLAVATYQRADDRQIGSVDVWRVERDAAGTPSLVLEHRVDAARGIHHVMWVR